MFNHIEFSNVSIKCMRGKDPSSMFQVLGTQNVRLRGPANSARGLRRNCPGRGGDAQGSGLYEGCMRDV